MCKIMIMPGIKPENVEETWAFVEEMSRLMSFSNSHGLGYAAINDKGNLFGERWFNNDDAFDVRNSTTDNDKTILDKFKGFLYTDRKPNVYNTFGDINDKSLKAITLHARFSTNTKSMENTHPFVRDNTSLIHNGIIRNHDKLKKLTSTCDSEVILNSYVDHDVMNDITAIQKVVDELQGYYACGVFSRTNEGKVILDVFKDTQAQLSAAFIEEFDTIVISTDLDDIKKACKTLNLTISSDYKVASNSLIRLDALTGEVIQTYEFKQKESSYSYNGYGNNYGNGWYSDEYGYRDNESKGTCNYEPKSTTAITTKSVMEVVDKANKTLSSISNGIKHKNKHKYKDNTYHTWRLNRKGQWFGNQT